MIQKTNGGKSNADEEIKKLRESMLEELEVHSLKSGGKQGYMENDHEQNIEETPP